ncbi:MAG: hypothetical protein Q8P73_00750 [bacterium]|nr:hypothetical protein [bacterium]
METMLVTGLVSVCVVAVFWLLIFIIWYPLFFSSPLLLPDDKGKKKKKRHLRDETRLKDDLEGTKATVGVNIVRLITPDSSGREDREILVNLGVAENRRADREDKPLEGDHWLCDGRPLWLAAFQLVPMLAIAMPLALIFDAFFTPLIVFVAVTLAWIPFSWWSVEENTRFGVRRFGRQLNGYLRPGLVFLVPWFEVGYVVTLQNFVWGPRGGEDPNDAFHIGGAMGDGQGNPEPGVFNVMLLGRWSIKVVIAITARVRRARKLAWYRWLNDYSSPEDLGEQFAAVVGSITSTKAREVDSEGSGDKDDPRQAFEAFLRFLNRTPEISGSSLLALQELGRERLGGVLPVSVAFANVIPGPELAGLLQRVDESSVGRLQDQMAGKGVALLLDEIDEAIRRVTGGPNPELVAEAYRLYIQQQFAGQPSGLEAVISSLAAQWSRATTRGDTT